MADIPYTLTPGQEEAIKVIIDKFESHINPICALSPGEGKTIIACTLIKKFMEEDHRGFLIIAKANNLNDPWMKELKTFSLSYNLIHGTNRKDYRIDNKYFSKKNTVLLTSHHTASLDIDYFVNTGTFSLIVIDEIHTIINPKKITIVSRQFSKLSAHRKLFLTATPIQNSKYDLGLLNGLLNRPKIISENDFGLDKKKKEILEECLEDAIEKNIVIGTNQDNQNKNYRNQAFLHKSKIILSIPISSEMDNYINSNQDIFFKKGTNGELFPQKKLMQYLSHPSAIYKNNTIIAGTHNCSKIETVLDIIDSIAKGDKIIIFSQFKDVLYRYHDLLTNKGYNSIIVTGEDKARLSHKLRLFRYDNAFRILLTTLFKSSEGLNLQEANHVIILELWWNPQKVIQAMGRIDRKTQKKDIFMYLLCYNKNGAIYESESSVFDTMNKKVMEAREILPSQIELPKIKTFSNENTYKDELGIFLSTFLNPPKKKIVIVNKKASTDKEKIGVVADESIIDNKVDNQTQEDNRTRVFLKALICAELENNFPNDNEYYKDLDLTNGTY
jgi:superfamily II DNA or RNA helicase